MTRGLVGGMLVLLLAGCSASEAQPPGHVLEIGDPPFVTKRFDSVLECEKFRDGMIVSLTLAGREVPKPMRCS